MDMELNVTCSNEDGELCGDVELLGAVIGNEMRGSSEQL